MSNLLFLGLFAVMAIYGAFTVVRNTRALRAARDYPDILLGWSERPRADFRADFPSWSAINLHRFTAIGLGVAVLVILLRAPLVDPVLPGLGRLLSLFVLPLAGGAVALMGFLWGFVAGGPVAEAIGGDRHYAVSERGLLVLGRLYAWSTIGEYSAEASKELIYLWSSAQPGTVAFLLRPPSADERERLVRILESHLPRQQRVPTALRRYRFPLAMLLFCAVFIAAAILLCSGPAPWALLTIPLLLWLFLALGSWLIMRIIFRGDGRPAGNAPAQT